MFTEDLSPGSSITDKAKRAAWLKERQSGIGASDAAAVFGLSPYKSPLALYFEKRGEVDVPESEREALYWGRILQSPIARRYEYETDRKVEEPDPYEIRRHATHPFMIATLDALAMPTPIGKQPPNGAGGMGVVEIKNAGFFKREDWRDEPPLAFQIQAQHQMFVTGAQWASIAALVGGVEFFWADLARHNGFIEVLLNRLGEFWEKVQAGTPPPADASESTRQLLKQLYPKDNGEIITLASKPWANVDDELVRIKAEQKKLQERRDELENQLKLAIGKATAAVIDQTTAVYTHKWQQRREFVTQASEFRVLRRKGE
jgi:putative phage-type endonuclease